MDKRAWSYSALNSFETCPYRHFKTRIEKSVVEPESEEIKWGNRVHKAAEDYIKKAKALPRELEYLQPTIDRIINAPGVTYGEQQYCLTSGFKPTSWWGSDAWVRVKIDVLKINGDWAFVGDWKTGKRKEDCEQLELFAATTFAVEPTINHITTGFIWLKDRELDTEKFKREDAPGIWQKFLPRVQRYDYAHEHDRWEQKPSGLCKKHCPVTACPFHGKGSR